MQIMKLYIITSFFLLMICLACTSDKDRKAEKQNRKVEDAMVFDPEKWMEKEGKDYLYREFMLEDVVYNDTVRSLNREELLSLFGQPDRMQENHLYYTISQKRLGAWTVHSRSMVIKLTNAGSVEWIKIHE